MKNNILKKYWWLIAIIFVFYITQLKKTGVGSEQGGAAVLLLIPVFWIGTHTWIIPLILGGLLFYRLVIQKKKLWWM